METLYYLIILCIVPVLLVLYKVIFKFSNDDLPPGNMGWPIIGETIEFLFCTPENFVLKRMKKYSPDIFKTNLFGEKMIVICGPKGLKFLFSNEQKYFTNFRPDSMKRMFQSHEKKLHGNKAQIQLDREKEAKILRSPGFLKPEALVHYVAKMDSITQEHMKAHWEGKAQVKTYHVTKILTLTLASQIFLGIDEPERIARLLENFDKVTVGMHSMVVNFPGTRFYKATKAASILRRELNGVIQEKKEAISRGGPMNDVLSHMIVATDPSGKYMSEAEIADKVMGLLVAGYHTVATTMAFFIKYVAQTPHVYQKVLQVQKEIWESKKAGELLEWDDIKKMKYSWNVVYEVMRFTPPIQGGFREVLTHFTYAGFTVPKGWKLYWTVSTTSKNPQYYPEPEKFEPSRYEDASSCPAFAFVPFGGGPRMCPGKEYTRLAVLTFIHNVVKKFEWELIIPNEKIEGDMMPYPQKGLPIRLRSNSILM
ncbi:hypothetical protein CsatB_001715 [Cannabis sativa]